MIQVIHRAFDIIEYCAKNQNKALSLSEIADEFKLNHATCANILKTLIERNYIEQMGYKKGYRLGTMCYKITGNVTLKHDLIQAAKVPMEEVVDELNETCLIGILRKSDFKRVVLHQVFCNQDLNVRTALEKNLYNTTSGRILLAYLTEKELESLIEKFGLPDTSIWMEACTREKLDLELKKIKQKGFALQNTSNQIIGLAVPIFRNGVSIASLSIYMPEMRYQGEMKAIVFDRLNQASQQINDNLAGIGTKY